MAPGRRLLLTARRRRLADESGQHLRRGRRPHVGERLEGLVGEVERVAPVDEHVVGDRGEHHPFDRARSAIAERGGQRRGQDPLGGVARPGVDETSVPAGQALGRDVGAPQLVDREPGRAVAGVPGDERQAVDQCERPVVLLEVGQQIGHRHEHREPGAPPRLPVRGAEVDAGPHDLDRVDAGTQKPEHGLGDDQREPVLQPVLQAGSQVLDPVTVRPGCHHDVAVLDRHVEGAGVVGEEVERATRGEVETRVMPVAGDEPVLDRAPVEGEAHVRAAVVDRPRPAVVPEHHDGDRAQLRAQPAGVPQLRQRSGPDPHGYQPTGWRRPRRAQTSAHEMGTRRPGRPGPQRSASGHGRGPPPA